MDMESEEFQAKIVHELRVKTPRIFHEIPDISHANNAGKWLSRGRIKRIVSFA